jgi:hypothetical protein
VAAFGKPAVATTSASPVPSAPNSAAPVNPVTPTTPNTASHPPVKPAKPETKPSGTFGKIKGSVKRIFGGSNE